MACTSENIAFEMNLLNIFRLNNLPSALVVRCRTIVSNTGNSFNIL